MRKIQLIPILENEEREVHFLRFALLRGLAFPFEQISIVGDCNTQSELIIGVRNDEHGRTRIDCLFSTVNTDYVSFFEGSTKLCLQSKSKELIVSVEHLQDPDDEICIKLSFASLVEFLYPGVPHEVAQTSWAREVAQTSNEKRYRGPIIDSGL